MLGWLLTTASVLTTADESESSEVISSMGVYGLAITFGLMLTWVIVASARWLEQTIYEHLGERLNSNIPRPLHTIGWGVVILIFVGPIGLAGARLFQPAGLAYWETALIVTLSLCLLVVSGAFVIGPADKRRRATHEMLSESVAAETIASYSAGEERLLTRVDELERLVADGLAELRTEGDPTPHPPRSTTYASWADWWRARPRPLK